MMGSTESHLAEPEAKTEEKVDEKPKKKPGRPRKIVAVEEPKPAGKRGRPRKVVVEEPVQEKRKVGRPKKIVKEEPVVEEAPKRGRGRPRKNIDGINEINKKIDAEEKKMKKMRSSIDKELKNAVSEINNVDDKKVKRQQLLKQIEQLQKEAQEVIDNNEPEERIIDVNNRLEKLLDEISKLDN